MKIALINPPQKYLNMGHGPRILEKHCYYPPLGLLYMHAHLKRNGFNEVYVWDGLTALTGFSYLQKKLLSKKPELIGISAYTSTLYDTFVLCRFIKKHLPESHLIIGGVHINVYPDETLDWPFVDSICVGDGEETIVELAQALSAKKSLNGIKGIWFKGGGTIVKNEPRPPVADLDSLSFPDRSLIPTNSHFSTIDYDGDQKKITSIIVGRGCPFECIFCYPHSRVYRHRSAKNILDEIEMLANSGYGYLKFWDYTFNVDRKLVEDIAHGIIDRGINITWGTRGRADIFDEKLAELLYRAGCRDFHFGVESSDPATLQTAGKMTSPEMFEKAVQAAKKYNIVTLAYFMIGFPNETREQIEATIDYSLKLDTDFALFHITSPFPETKLYKMALEAGGIKNDYYREYARNPTKKIQLRLWITSIPEKDLLKYLKGAYRKFYFRKRFLFNKKIWKLAFFRFFRILLAVIYVLIHQLEPVPNQSVSDEQRTNS